MFLQCWHLGAGGLPCPPPDAALRMRFTDLQPINTMAGSRPRGLPCLHPRSRDVKSRFTLTRNWFFHKKCYLYDVFLKVPHRVNRKKSTSYDASGKSASNKSLPSRTESIFSEIMLKSLCFVEPPVTVTRYLRQVIAFPWQLQEGYTT